VVYHADEVFQDSRAETARRGADNERLFLDSLPGKRTQRRGIQVFAMRPGGPADPVPTILGCFGRNFTGANKNDTLPAFRNGLWIKPDYRNGANKVNRLIFIAFILKNWSPSSMAARCGRNGKRPSNGNHTASSGKWRRCRLRGNSRREIWRAYGRAGQNGIRPALVLKSITHTTFSVIGKYVILFVLRNERHVTS